MAKKENKDLMKKHKSPKQMHLRGNELEQTASNKPVESKTKGQKGEKGGKFAKFFKNVKKSLKETFAEVKKVTWSSLPNALKQTGVVLVVILFFVIIIGSFDALLAFILKLLTKANG